MQTRSADKNYNPAVSIRYVEAGSLKAATSATLRMTAVEARAKSANPGSSSFITDATGYAVQHLQYLPFGETFVDQQNGYDSRYTFSAKEKDDETQYSYFGARYYDSDLSMWLSVDPMAGKYPSTSPYMYCLGNPVRLVDPNGEEVINGVRESDNYKEAKSNYEFSKSIYDGLKAIHQGSLSTKDDRKYMRQSGLNRAQREYNRYENIASTVDQMISTFKAIMPDEFNRIDNYKDIDGNAVDVMVNYVDHLSPKGANNYASTNLNLETAVWVAYGSGKSSEFVWTGKFTNNRIDVSLFSNGLKTNYLANEFGDIVFLMNNVKAFDGASLNHLITTGNSSFPGYRNDPTGSGQFSFDFQMRFQKAFMSYAKGNNYQNVRTTNYTITK